MKSMRFNSKRHEDDVDSFVDMDVFFSRKIKFGGKNLTLYFGKNLYATDGHGNTTRYCGMCIYNLGTLLIDVDRLPTYQHEAVETFIHELIHYSGDITGNYLGEEEVATLGSILTSLFYAMGMFGPNTYKKLIEHEEADNA
jgi:hypothetical protein